MVIQNYKDIRKRAAKTLDYTPWDVKKLALVFALVSCCLSPLLVGVNALLELGKERAQGISGLDMFTKLETVSWVLTMVLNIFVCFWTPGILYGALMVLREKDPWPKSLFRGFKQWKNLVKYGAVIVAFYIVLVLVLSPVITIASLPFMGAYMQILENAPTTEAELAVYLESIPQQQVLMALLPMLIIAWVSVLAVLIPLTYRVRVVTLLLLDEEQIGIFAAIRYSFRVTKGSCWQLFRLDLSFWWYYLLRLVVTVLPMAALLPVFADWNVALADFVCTLGAAVVGVGVYMLGLMKVNTAEAVAYDHLRTVVLSDLQELPEGAKNG